MTRDSFGCGFGACVVCIFGVVSFHGDEGKSIIVGIATILLIKGMAFGFTFMKCQEILFCYASREL